MIRVFCFSLLAAMAVADTGTPVRPGASDYDSRQTIKDATIAASLLSPAETAKVFSNAVSRNFTVVEIAVYPENGGVFDLQALDFAVRISPDDRVYAVTPEEVAWHGKRPPATPAASSSGIGVITEIGVGVGAGTNPATGKTGHNVYTYGGVGVTNRPQTNMPPPQSSSADNTYVLEGKLRGLELQEGQTPRPISGYLYFPAGKRPKNAPLLLEYSRSGEKALLTLPIR